MYEFALYSRKGRTDGRFKTLLAGGRLDIVYQCILSPIFKSHGHRHDVVFHAFLGGPPLPPVHLEVRGDELHDARLDEVTWAAILKKVLSGGTHPGVTAQKRSLQAFIKSRVEAGINIFVLEERGKEIAKLDPGEDAVFVLGDHIGLPKKDEKFVLRFGEKISLGKQRYLAMSCIDIVNYHLDEFVLKKLNVKR